MRLNLSEQLRRVQGARRKTRKRMVIQNSSEKSVIKKGIEGYP